jgi:hypothetical protein
VPQAHNRRNQARVNWVKHRSRCRKRYIARMLRYVWGCAHMMSGREKPRYRKWISVVLVTKRIPIPRNGILGWAEGESQ